jgi:hypothetical protein
MPTSPKPASNINRWGEWPADVNDRLYKMNRMGPDMRLTFRRIGQYPFQTTSRTGMHGLFMCTDCAALCEAHQYGAAVLDGLLYCDDCLIEKVRREVRIFGKKSWLCWLGIHRPFDCGIDDRTFPWTVHQCLRCGYAWVEHFTGVINDCFGHEQMTRAQLTVLAEQLGLLGKKRGSNGN